MNGGWAIYENCLKLSDLETPFAPHTLSDGSKTEAEMAVLFCGPSGRKIVYSGLVSFCLKTGWKSLESASVPILGSPRVISYALTATVEAERQDILDQPLLYS